MASTPQLVPVVQSSERRKPVQSGLRSVAMARAEFKQSEHAQRKRNFSRKPDAHPLRLAHACTMYVDSENSSMYKNLQVAIA